MKIFSVDATNGTTGRRSTLREGALSHTADSARVARRSASVPAATETSGGMTVVPNGNGTPPNSLGAQPYQVLPAPKGLPRAATALGVSPHGLRPAQHWQTNLGMVKIRPELRHRTTQRVSTTSAPAFPPRGGNRT